MILGEKAEAGFLPHPQVLRTVDAGHDLPGADAAGVVEPRLLRAEEPTGLLHEQVRLRAGKDDHVAAGSADSKDRTQGTILFREELLEIALHRQAVADQRQSRRLGDCPCRRRGADVFLPDFPERLGNRPPDQVDLPKEVDPLLGLALLRLGENPSEGAGGLGQRNDHGVPRVGNVVAEQRTHDAQADIVHRPPVGPRVAASERRPGRQLDGPVGRRLENTQLAQPRQRNAPDLGSALRRSLDQPRQRNAPDLGPALRHSLDPVDGVVRAVPSDGFPCAGRGVRHDLGQRGIEQSVAQRRRIDQREALEVRVDTIRESEVRQGRAGQNDVERIFPECGNEVCPPLVVEKQESLLDNRQHRRDIVAISMTRAPARGESSDDFSGEVGGRCLAWMCVAIAVPASDDSAAPRRTEIVLAEARGTGVDLPAVRPDPGSGPPGRSRRIARLRDQGRDLDRLSRDLDRLEQAACIVLRSLHHDTRSTIHSTRSIAAVRRSSHGPRQPHDRCSGNPKTLPLGRSKSNQGRSVR